jgi:cytochrome c553
MTALLVIVSFLLGFIVVGREQLNAPSFGVWAAICRCLGLTADTAAASRPQPPLRTPSRIAWTHSTLAQIEAGKLEHGAFVALMCSACHGKEGVSASGLYPTLAGMPAAVIFKQIDDFRAGKRSSGVMNAIASALTVRDSADVAAYFASRTGGPPSEASPPLQGGHTLREADPAIRLAFAGDPARGLPPCTACHGPGSVKLGAPRLHGQQAAYIERQLAAFAEGIRKNDINEEMRTIASQLTSSEMHRLAEFYGSRSAAPVQVAQR